MSNQPLAFLGRFTSCIRRALLMLAAVAAFASAYAADSLIEFRSELWEVVGIESIPAGSPSPHLFSFTAPPVERKALAPSTIKSIGGIIFFESASPSPGHDSCPTITYDTSRPNGNRLIAKFRTGQAVGSIYDWEVIPVVKFVSSGDHGLFTYMGQHAEYHQAFADNLAGVNLFFVDTMRQNPVFADIHRSLGIAVPGYPQTESTIESKQKTSEIQKRLGVTQLMFTDEGVQFLFSNRSGRLSISGSPFWMAVQRASDGSGRELFRLDDSSMIIGANQVVYSSAFRIARYSAFFRYIKTNCQSQWVNFTSDLDRKRGEIDVIRVVRMPYKI